MLVTPRKEKTAAALIRTKYVSGEEDSVLRLMVVIRYHHQGPDQCETIETTDLMLRPGEAGFEAVQNKVQELCERLDSSDAGSTQDAAERTFSLLYCSSSLKQTSTKAQLPPPPPPPNRVSLLAGLEFIL